MSTDSTNQGPKGISTLDKYGNDLGTWSDYYDGFTTLPEICRHITNLQPFIAKCEAFFPGRRILEIGTGTGLVSIYFSQLGYNVTGLDFDYQILAKNLRLNRMFNGSACFVNGDMFSLPFAPDTFDAGYHQGLMEHFDEPDIVKSLEDQLSVCKHIVFAVPTILWRGGVFGNERLWSGKKWLELLSGFRVLDVFGMSYSGIFSRATNFVGRRLTRGRPRPIHRAVALRRAGLIGFVIAKN